MELWRMQPMQSMRFRHSGIWTAGGSFKLRACLGQRAALPEFASLRTLFESSGESGAQTTLTIGHTDHGRAGVLIDLAASTFQASPVWKTILPPWEFTSIELATLAFALLASSGLLYVLAQALERKHCRLPPGPWSWPIVGNLLVMASDLPHRTLGKLSNQHGDVMYLRFGSTPCLVVSSAAAAREMTRPSTDASFSNRPKSLFAAIFSDNYNTIIHAPHGPYWRLLRKFSSSELFSPLRHASYQDAREQELRNMMTVLVQQADKGETVNVKSWLFELSTNVMTRMLINKRYFGSGGASQEERNEIQQLFVTLLRVSTRPVIGDFIPSLSFVAKLQGTDKLFESLRDDALRVVGKMMELENHRERAKERLGDDDSYVPDFVDVISAAPLVDGTQPLPDRIQTLQLLELLFGGTETASTTVEWAMAEVVANPDVMKQAQQELDAVVGRIGNGHLMQESDLPNLPFLRAIVKETFRLHPPAPLPPPRSSTQAVEAWGYRIPADGWIFLNLHAIHRDPDLYTNPDAFNPERFMDRPEVNAQSGVDFYGLIPFGVGRRVCPAAQLGDTMVHLMLGNLLHSYHWSLPKDTSLERFRRDNQQEIFGLTVCRKEPLLLVATPRDADAASST